MTAFITAEAKGRPQGAPEFLAYSPKNACQIRLYCRPSFWRWATTEFDPNATDVLVNQLVLNTPARKISVALQYEITNSTYFVFSRREAKGNIVTEILEYAAKSGVQCEFLGDQCKQEDQVHAENLLCMLSYINKFRMSLSDRNLDCALRVVDRSQGVISDAILNLQQKFPENAGALLFELVRRGRLCIPDVQQKRINGSTRLNVAGVWRG